MSGKLSRDRDRHRRNVQSDRDRSRSPVVSKKHQNNDENSIDSTQYSHRKEDKIVLNNYRFY